VPPSTALHLRACAAWRAVRCACPTCPTFLPHAIFLGATQRFVAGQASCTGAACRLLSSPATTLRHRRAHTVLAVLRCVAAGRRHAGLRHAGSPVWLRHVFAAPNAPSTPFSRSGGNAVRRGQPQRNYRKRGSRLHYAKQALRAYRYSHCWHNIQQNLRVRFRQACVARSLWCLHNAAAFMRLLLDRGAWTRRFTSRMCRQAAASQSTAGASQTRWVRLSHMPAAARSRCALLRLPLFSLLRWLGCCAYTCLRQRTFLFALAASRRRHLAAPAACWMSPRSGNGRTGVTASCVLGVAIYHHRRAVATPAAVVWCIAG